jgi:hypothetical protein
MVAFLLYLLVAGGGIEPPTRGFSIKITNILLIKSTT